MADKNNGTGSHYLNINGSAPTRDSVARTANTLETPQANLQSMLYGFINDKGLDDEALSQLFSRGNRSAFDLSSDALDNENARALYDMARNLTMNQQSKALSESEAKRATDDTLKQLQQAYSGMSGNEDLGDMWTADDFEWDNLNGVSKITNMLGDGYDAVKTGVGTAVDAIADNTVGNLIGLINSDWGEGAKNLLNGEDVGDLLSGIADVAAIGLTGGAAAPVIAGKNLLLDNSDMLTRGINGGYDPLAANKSEAELNDQAGLALSGAGDILGDAALSSLAFLPGIGKGIGNALRGEEALTKGVGKTADNVLREFIGGNSKLAGKAEDIVESVNKLGKKNMYKEGSTIAENLNPKRISNLNSELQNLKEAKSLAKKAGEKASEETIKKPGNALTKMFGGGKEITKEQNLKEAKEAVDKIKANNGSPLLSYLKNSLGNMGVQEIGNTASIMAQNPDSDMGFVDAFSRQAPDDTLKMLIMSAIPRKGLQGKLNGGVQPYANSSLLPLYLNVGANMNDGNKVGQKSDMSDTQLLDYWGKRG